MELGKDLFGIQAEIIRLIQTANGQISCYATPIDGECSKMECTWRDDCFDEACEVFPSLQIRKPVGAKSFNIPAKLIKFLQTNDVENTRGGSSHAI